MATKPAALANTSVPLVRAMLCWNADRPNQRGPVGARVVWYPDRAWQADAYRVSVGACFSEWGGMSDRQRRLQLMLDAWAAVVRDGVPAAAMHEALLAIPEFRAMMSSDCGGEPDASA